MIGDPVAADDAATEKEEAKEAPAAPAKKKGPPLGLIEKYSPTGLTIGTMSTLVGVITLTTPSDPNQQVLGWTATGLGVTLLATGVLFSKLEGDAIAELEAKKAEEEPKEKKTDDTVKSY